MNKYESVIIMSSTTNEDERKNILEKIKQIIVENNGEIIEIQEIGFKKLAYEIKKNRDGYYLVIVFSTDSNVVAEVERYYRLTESIIKFLTIRKEDD